MAEGFEEIFDYTMVPHCDLTAIFGLSNGLNVPKKSQIKIF